jgi:tight adherence protein B
MNLIVLIVGGIAVVILAIGIFSSYRERGQVQDRLERFVESDRGAVEAAKPMKRSSPVGDALNKFLTGRAFADTIGTELARADLKFTIGEYMALLVIVVIGGGVIGYIVGRASPIFAVVGAVGGFFVPRIYVGYMQGRRLQMFNNQLGDTLNQMVNGLRSGYSVLQAMESVARDLPQPVSGEFDRIVKEVQLGLTLEQALQNMLRRVRSDDLDLVVTAINVQREVGGNLAEILEVIGHTIRERVRIKGEVKVLTAQGMITGYVISGLPIALFGFLALVNPEYTSRLWTTGLCGYSMLGAGITMIVVGFLIIQKIVQIEV